MASRFSGALQITNLDDFITPSQECIKPIEIKPVRSTTGAKIKIEADGNYIEVDNSGTSEILQKVEITLADCLACSGCITSAETVLITQQNQTELLRVFREKVAQNVGSQGSTKFIVVSLSIQPILSIAHHYNLKPNVALRKLAGYFYRLGADAVMDMTMADDISLLESAKEFVKRYRASQEGIEEEIPMLSSSCPGWVCYAEKTHGKLVLPLISITKSPQQIMGSLVKYHLTEVNKLNPEQIYHVTLMPCYDKKLEATRNDFCNDQTQVKDVDCVITSVELQNMLNENGITLNEIEEGEIKKPFGTCTEIPEDLYSHKGSGSGGYADFIFRYAAKHLFNEPHVNVEFKSLRNPDFQEAILEKDGQTLLRFAVVNGFKNIQNLVQKLKRKKCSYHYVEVMACPCGCLNGGAQIKPQIHFHSRDHAMKLETMYRELPLIEPEENLIVHELYKNLIGNDDTDEKSNYFHTTYHQVEPMNTALTIKW